MFGGLNALFSGLAFVGLIYAILLQREELELQRVELRETKAELAGSRQAQETQNTFVEQQTFENTFFQLLASLNHLIEGIDLRVNGNETAKGRDAIAVFYSRLDREMTRQRDHGKGDEQDRLREAYRVFYKNYGSELGHYFRSLYNVFKFIHRSSVANRVFYAHIVRSQMSNIEANLLFYDSLAEVGKKFLPLVNEYHLLKHIDDARLLGHDRLLHEPSAFEDGDDG